MKVLRLIGAGAIVGAAGVAGTLGVSALSSNSRPVDEPAPFADASVGALAGEQRVTVVDKAGLRIELTRETDGTLCATASTGDGGTGSCFTDDQIAAGVAHVRYQERPTLDGLLMGVAPDSAAYVMIDGSLRAEIVDNVWHAFVTPLSGGSEYTIHSADGFELATVDVITPAEGPLPSPVEGTIPVAGDHED